MEVIITYNIGVLESKLVDVCKAPLIAPET